MQGWQGDAVERHNQTGCQKGAQNQPERPGGRLPPPVTRGDGGGMRYRDGPVGPCGQRFRMLDTTAYRSSVQRARKETSLPRRERVMPLGAREQNSRAPRIRLPLPPECSTPGNLYDDHHPDRLRWRRWTVWDTHPGYPSPWSFLRDRSGRYADPVLQAGLGVADAARWAVCGPKDRRDAVSFARRFGT